MIALLRSCVCKHDITVLFNDVTNNLVGQCNNYETKTNLHLSDNEGICNNSSNITKNIIVISDVTANMISLMMSSHIIDYCYL